MATARMRRVNEAIREILAGAIATELKDPRIGFVTVTDVDTSPDLRAARVYVSVLGSQEEREDSLAGRRVGLNGAEALDGGAFGRTEVLGPWRSRS